MSPLFQKKMKFGRRSSRARADTGKATLRLQIVLVAVAILLRALFWALQVHSSMLLLLALTLVLGNVANAISLFAQPRFAALPGSRKWIANLGLLAVAGAVAAVLVQLLLFTLRGGALRNFAWTGTDVRVSVLITVVISVVAYGAGQFFTDTKTRLESQNRELQGQVQFGLVREQAQEAELESAQEIQMHLLPRDTPQVPGFKIACAWQPAKSVSGDYFDVFPLGEGRLALVLADVSGKGIGAALLMANLQASVRAFAQDAVSPSELCSRLNKALCSNIAPGKFVTLFYGIVDASTKEFSYENAGHCLPLMVRADGSILMPASYSGVLGLFSHWTYQDSALQFEPGDSLLIVTDGVLEAANQNDEEYGYQRLIALVQRQRREAAATAHDLRKAILGDVSSFCNGVFQDDASLIVVTVD
ncbi:MAG TPA: PP2C family protein-serine/threonine phosphatase [Acidisarcina sp.]